MKRLAVLFFLGGALLLSSAVVSASPHVGGNPGGQAVVFDDIDGDHWAAKYILKAKLSSVIQGYSDQTFRPDRYVTRQEAVAMVIRALGLEDQAIKAGQGNVTLPYPDAVTISHWAKGYIRLALDLGILDPDEPAFQPSTPASRLWLVEVMVKALGYGSTGTGSTVKLPFIDAGAIPASERVYVAIARDLGLVGGYPDNTFRPNNPVTRAETARLLDSMRLQIQNPVQTPVAGQSGVVTGTVYSVSGKSITLTFGNVNKAVYTVAYDTFVFVNDRVATISDIMPGQIVSLFMDAKGKVVLVDASSGVLPVTQPVLPLTPETLPLTAAQPPFLTKAEIKGFVEGLDEQTGVLSLRTAFGEVYDLDLGQWVKVELPGDRYGNLSDIQDGDLVEVKVRGGVVTEIDVKNNYGWWNTGQGVNGSNGSNSSTGGVTSWSNSGQSAGNATGNGGNSNSVWGNGSSSYDSDSSVYESSSSTYKSGIQYGNGNGWGRNEDHHGKGKDKKKNKHDKDDKEEDD